MAKQSTVKSKKTVNTTKKKYTKNQHKTGKSGKNAVNVHLTEQEIRKYHAFTQKLLTNLERVIRGKRECLEYLITGLIAGGHILIEDVPGLGKTTLAKYTSC